MPLLPQYVFMAWCLVKHRDNLILPYPSPHTEHFIPISKKSLLLEFKFWKILISNLQKVTSTLVRLACISILLPSVHGFAYM
jgi:hypothetical protein